MDTHPSWLKKSKIPLTIVCGPPCSGKTTFVQKSAGPDDIVIDLDTIRRKIDPTYRHWSSRRVDEKLLLRSMRVRNMMLGQLYKRTTGKAFFIIGAPTKKEREWWAHKLGGMVVLLNPGIEECKRRAVARGTPLAVDGITTWEHKSTQAWHAPAPRHRIGIDGWIMNDMDEADVVLVKELNP